MAAAKTRANGLRRAVESGMSFLQVATDGIATVTVRAVC